MTSILCTRLRVSSMRTLRVMGLATGAPLHERSSGPEPGHLVSPPRESDSVRGADHTPSPPWSDDRPRGGRHGGTLQRGHDHRQGLLSGCRALLDGACDPLFRPEVGVNDAVGPGAMGAVGVGVAPSHRTGLARRIERRAQTRVGLLMHRPVVYPPLAPCRHPLPAGGRSGGETADGSLFLSRPGGHAR